MLPAAGRGEGVLSRPDWLLLVLPRELHQGLGQTLYRRKAVQSNKLGDYRLYLAKIWPIEEAETSHYWEKGIDMIMAKVFPRSHHELLSLRQHKPWTEFT